MKHLIIGLIYLIPCLVYGQDIIRTQSGDSIKCKISLIARTYILYKPEPHSTDKETQCKGYSSGALQCATITTNDNYYCDRHQGQVGKVKIKKEKVSDYMYQFTWNKVLPSDYSEPIITPPPINKTLTADYQKRMAELERDMGRDLRTAGAWLVFNAIGNLGLNIYREVKAESINSSSTPEELTSIGDELQTIRYVQIGFNAITLTVIGGNLMSAGNRYRNMKAEIY